MSSTNMSNKKDMGKIIIHGYKAATKIYNLEDFL